MRAGGEPLAAARGLCKVYRRGAAEVHALRDVDLTVARGEFLGVTGPSGSGKSTLLHILGCLDSPSSGTYLLDGRDVSTLPDGETSRLRASAVGFVFQTFNLVPSLTVMENVMLPYLYRREPAGTGRERAEAAVWQVGLADRARHLPRELSGGEMQRAAVARALAAEPLMILADEPTGNLDSGNAASVMNLFRRLNEEGMTVVVVTHDREVSALCGRTVTVRDGRLTE